MLHVPGGLQDPQRVRVQHQQQPVGLDGGRDMDRLAVAGARVRAAGQGMEVGQRQGGRGPGHAGAPASAARPGSYRASVAESQDSRRWKLSRAASQAPPAAVQ